MIHAVQSTAAILIRCEEPYRLVRVVAVSIIKLRRARVAMAGAVGGRGQQDAAIVRQPAGSLLVLKHLTGVLLLYQRLLGVSTRD
jgi:hypothetical protein